MKFEPGRAYLGSDGIRYLARELVLNRAFDFVPLSFQRADLQFIAEANTFKSGVTIDHLDYLDYNRSSNIITRLKDYFKKYFVCPVNIKKYDEVYVKSLKEYGIVVASDSNERLVVTRKGRRWCSVGDLEFEYRPFKSYRID